MADINKRKRDNNDTGEAVGTGVGAFTGDTMASALDPFGTGCRCCFWRSAGQQGGERYR